MPETAEITYITPYLRTYILDIYHLVKVPWQGEVKERIVNIAQDNKLYHMIKKP